jgi:hypothetical protein
MVVGLRSKFHGTRGREGGGGGSALTLGIPVLRETGNCAYHLLWHSVVGNMAHSVFLV